MSDLWNDGPEWQCQMTPELIFYWTGFVVCLALCVGFGATVIVAAVVAPFLALKNVKRFIWQWIYADQVVYSGLTQEELSWALAEGDVPEGYNIKKMIAWVESIRLKEPIRKGFK